MRPRRFAGALLARILNVVNVATVNPDSLIVADLSAHLQSLLSEL